MSAYRQGLRRALRQPTALAFAFSARFALAYLCASPVVRALMGSGVANHPRGDAILFDAGAARLVEAVRLAMPELRAELGGSLFVGAVGAWLLLVPHGALFASLAASARMRFSELCTRAFALFPRFTLLGGAICCLQGGALLVASLVASGVESRFATTGAERRADLMALGAIGIGALITLFAQLWLDLARAAVVVDDARFFAALRIGFGALTRRPAATLASWIVAPAALAVSVVLAALAVGRLDVSRVGAWRVLLVFVVHQLVIAAWLVLRAGWLGATIDLVGPSSVQDRALRPSAPSALGAQGVPVDLQVAPGGSVPSEIEAHHPAHQA